MNKRMLVIVAPVLLAVVLFFSCNKAKPVKAQRKSITEAVYASGFVIAKDEYKVYALGDGYITGKFKQDGDDVKKDEPLFHIQNDVSAARAGASSSAYELAKMNAADNSAVLIDLRSKVQSARAKYTNDSRNLTRYKNMLAAGAVTKAQYDQVALAYEVSGNDLKSATQALQQRKDQLQVELRNAESTLTSSNVDLSNYIVRSNMDGQLYETYKENGEAVRRNDVVALIGQKNHKLLQLSVDQQDIDKVKLGQQVIVKMDVTGDKIYKATISKIYPNMNQNDQSFKVEAEFNENYGLGFIHTSVEANIIIASKDNALVIPKEAVQANDEVEIIGTGFNKKVKIKTGMENMEFVEVLDGLTENDELVMPKAK